MTADKADIQRICQTNITIQIVNLAPRKRTICRDSVVFYRIWNAGTPFEFSVWRTLLQYGVEVTGNCLIRNKQYVAWRATRAICLIVDWDAGDASKVTLHTRLQSLVKVHTDWTQPFQSTLTHNQNIALSALTDSILLK